jgi:hypothetical protein
MPEESALPDTFFDGAVSGATCVADKYLVRITIEDLALRNRDAWVPVTASVWDACDHLWV